MPKMENRALGEVAGPTLISGNLDTKRVIPFVATLLLVADFDHIGLPFQVRSATAACGRDDMDVTHVP